MSAQKYKDRVRIEAPSAGAEGDYGTAVGPWTPVIEVWAEIVDTMPSRSETTANGLRLASDSARIRIRYRTGISSDMRVVELTGRKRTLSIVGGPAAIFGQRELEFTVERFSS